MHTPMHTQVMDPGTPLMRETWADAVGRIANTYNTSGVYTDQVLGGVHQPGRRLLNPYMSSIFIDSGGVFIRLILPAWV